MDLQIRFSEKRDITILVRMVREGFRGDIADKLIYGTKGIHNYIGMQLEEKNSDTRYITVEKEGEIIGFVEYRYLPNSLVLNYIVIDKKYQGKGLASGILWKSIGLLNPVTRRLVLDVFDYNTPALCWYQKIGFKQVSTSFWYDLKCGDLKEEGNKVYIMNSPQACVLYQNFGFSTLTLRSGQYCYNVGLLGEHWLRITQKEILSDSGALLFLSKKYPERKIFALLPERISFDKKQNIQGCEILKSFRMEYELNK